MEYGGHTTYIAKGEDEEVATSLFLLSIFIINLCMSDNGAISVTVVENYYNDVWYLNLLATEIILTSMLTMDMSLSKKK